MAAQRASETTLALRWAFVPFVIMVAFFIGGMIGASVFPMLGLWFLPGAGAGTAFAVVLVAYLAAPVHKIRTALLALVVGAILAWPLLVPSYYPDSYGPGFAYQETWLPIAATWAGGLAGLLVSVLVHRLAHPGSSLKPGPCAG